MQKYTKNLLNKNNKTKATQWKMHFLNAALKIFWGILVLRFIFKIKEFYKENSLI